jgi:hypothetical protein
VSVIVTIAHVRAEHLCARGARAWFAQHGLDFRAFCRDGMPLADVEAINDGFAQRIAARARMEATDGRA